MNNAIGKKFTFWSLVLFTLPNIIMMVFNSLYTIVDGIFVSRFVGTDALSAINIVYPVMCIEMAVGIMFATGASAVIARKMGEGKMLEAKQDFSFIMLVVFLIGIATAILGNIFISPILRVLGARGDIYDLCQKYLTVLLYFAPAFFLQIVFQFFFVTAGKPTLGLCVILMGGFVNIILDYIFIVPMAMGITGAAIATGIGYCISAVIGLIYFAFWRNSSLCFVRPKYNKKTLTESCTNGSSEMVTNLSTAVTTFLFNIITLRYYGASGVASITILLYAQYLFTAIYLGFSAGVAPIISYNYGSQNTKQLKNLFKLSMIFIIICSVASYVLSILLSSSIASVFSKRGSEVFDITLEGFSYFSIGFLFMGINIFASSFFTALSDGKTSAFLSFIRTFVFIVAGIWLLPLVFHGIGIWLAVPVAELLGVIVTVACLGRMRTVYGYA